MRRPGVWLALATAGALALAIGLLFVGSEPAPVSTIELPQRIEPKAARTLAVAVPATRTPASAPRWLLRLFGLEPKDSDATRSTVDAPKEPFAVEVADRRTGAPIHGALVHFRNHDRRTDRGGIATFASAAPPGELLFARARAAEYAPGWARSVGSAPGTTSLRILLGRGGTLEGTVEDPTGRRVAGAKVEVRLEHPFEWTAWTDERGRFVIPHVSTPADVEQAHMSRTDRPLVVRVSASGHPSFEDWVAPPEEGEKRVLALRFAVPRTLTGRVALRDATPVPGVIIRSDGSGASARGGSGPSAVTAVDGSFEMPGVGPGRRWLSVLDGGGRTLLGSYRVDVPREGSVPAVTIVVESAEPRVRALDVLVLDARGSPVSGARVGIDVEHLVSSATTDAKGLARIEGLPKRPLAVFVDSRAGVAEGEVVDLSVASSVTIRLGAGTIAGRVVDGAGRPREAALALGRVVRSSDALTGLPIEHRGPPPEPAVVTSPDGTFRIDGVGSDEYWLWYGLVGDGSRRGRLPEPVRAGTSDVLVTFGSSPERRRAWIELEMEGEAPPRRLESPMGLRALDDAVHVRLEDPDGKVASISLLPSETRDLYRQWGTDDDVAPGEYQVTVLQSGALPVPLGRQRVTAGTTRWKVTRALGARVEGTVTTPDGAPLERIFLRAGPRGWPFDRTSGVQSGHTDASGRYAISGLLDGEVELVVRPSWGSSPVVETSRRATVATGTPTRLDIVVVVGGSLDISVDDAARLREGLALRLTAQSGEFRERKKTAREVADERNRGGRHSYPWKMEGLAPGKHRVELVWDGVTQRMPDVEIRPLETSLLVVPPK